MTVKNYLSSVGLTNVWFIWPLSSLTTMEIKKKKKKRYQTILKEQKVLKEKRLCYNEQLVAATTFTDAKIWLFVCLWPRN